MKAAAGQRVTFLDGIRGFMALNVIIGHFVLIYYPAHTLSVMTGTGFQLTAQLDLILRSLLMNGAAAVQYFFVLTGFLVGRSFLPEKQWKQEQLLQKCCNRYLRMLPMVAAATVFTWLTMVLGLQFHLQIADKLPDPEAVRGYCDISPTVPFMIRTVFYKTFIENSLYISPFWTIRYEFWGYILCLLTCYVLQGSKLRRLGYCVVLFLVWTQVSEYFVGFFLGVLTADLCCNTQRDTTVLSRFYGKILYSPVTAWLLVLPGAVLAFYPLPDFSPMLNNYTIKAFGHAILLFSIMKLPVLARPFEGKLMQAMGKISFGVYAFHWPIMLSLGAKLFDLLSGPLSYDAAAWGAFFLTFPVILAAGWAAYRLFEVKCRIDAGALLNKLKISQSS